MRDLLFIIFYCLPFIALALYRDKGGLLLLRVNCANVLMLFYLVVNHIGLPWFYLHPLGFKQLKEINEDTVLLLAFYSIIVVAAYVVSGLSLGARFSGVRVPNVRKLRGEKINFRPIILVAVIALPISIAKVLDASPLLVLLSGDALGAATARVEAVTNPQSFMGIKESYVNIIYHILGFAAILVLVAALEKKSAKYFAFYMMLLLISSLYWFSNVSKGFIVGPIYSVIFCFSLLFCNGFIVNKMILWGLAVVLTVVSVFTAWVMGNQEISFVYPFERLVFGNLLPQYVVVNFFGWDNLLYGTSVPSWYSLGLHQQFLIDVWAWKEIMEWSVGQDFYTAPSSFVAEAHANFHFFGVIIESLVVFFLIRIVDFHIKKVKSELIYTALMVFSSLHLSYISVSPAAGMLFNYYYWAVLLFSLFFYQWSIFQPNSALKRSRNF
jgi:hypothetical protein